MAPGATFVFDNVITNLRNGYNRHSGHFRAPISGTYMIAFSIMADWNNELYARLLVDGTFMAESVSHSKDAWDHATGSLVLHLSAGQAAWLTHSSAHPRSVRAKQGVWSTFSGFLIKADP
nr:hypothetical protein BaRGS_014468 [Batillaria attramentaria]